MKAYIYKITCVLGLLIFLLTTDNTKAEIMVQQLPLNPFRFKAIDAMNLNLVNTSDKGFRVKIFSEIISSTGQTLAKIESEPCFLNKGANIISPYNLAAANIEYTTAEIAKLHEIDYGFPAGNYRICVALRCISLDCDGAGQGQIKIEELNCIEIIVEPVTPLLLAYPLNKSTIEENRPSLNWIPPMPIGNIENLTYRLVLTKKLENQSAIDAIMRNRPIIFTEINIATMLSFPSDIEALDQNGEYAWKVEAWLGNFFVATSEVWEFKLKRDSIPVKNHQDFIKVNSISDGSIKRVYGELRLNYNEPSLKTASLRIIIIDPITNTEVFLTNEQAVFGDNYYKINLNNSGLTDGKHYVVRIITPTQTQILNIRFQHSN